MLKEVLNNLWAELQSLFTWETILIVISISIVITGVAVTLVYFNGELKGNRYTEVNKTKDN